MGYNITSTTLHVADAKNPPRIRATDLISFHRQFEAAGQLPSYSFLAKYRDGAAGILQGVGTEVHLTEVHLTAMPWSGEWSGHCVKELEACLRVTRGVFDLMLTWEGGDSFTGYRVRDGEVEECEVVHLLVQMGKKKEVLKLLEEAVKGSENPSPPSRQSYTPVRPEGGIRLWVDPDGCSHCEHCGMDMDMAPYCNHPSVVAKHPHGLVIRQAIEDFCGDGHKLALWHPRAKK